MSTTQLTRPLPDLDFDHPQRSPACAAGHRPVASSCPVRCPNASIRPVPLGHACQFGRIAEAHVAMEASQATGKLVVLTWPGA
jgi:hypothetical protein